MSGRRLATRVCRELLRRVDRKGQRCERWTRIAERGLMKVRGSLKNRGLARACLWAGGQASGLSLQMIRHWGRRMRRGEPA